MMMKRPKMLLVDDEPHILEALSQLFDFDFNVLSAQSGERALEVLRENPDIAIVISDQRMPGMKGVDVLKNVKMMAPNSMRILLTGYADLEAVLDSVNVGEVFRYVRKPWVPETLKSIVALAMASYMLRCQKVQRQAKRESEIPASLALKLNETSSENPIPIIEGLNRRKTDSGYTPPLEITEAPKEEVNLLRRKSDQLFASFEEEYYGYSDPEPRASNAEPDAVFQSFEEEFFASFRQEAIQELKKFESFEEGFFIKLNEKTSYLEQQRISNSSQRDKQSAKPVFEQIFHGRSGKPKILLVDDEARVLTALSELLQPEFDVLTCNSADAALDILESNAFIACIMTDMRMPNKSGGEFLTQAQSMAPLVPKILLTAYADIEEIVGMINNGLLFRHLSKPWDVEMLKKTLIEAVSVCREKVETGMESRAIQKNRPLLEMPIAKPNPPVKNGQNFSPKTIENLRKLNELTHRNK